MNFLRILLPGIAFSLMGVAGWLVFHYFQTSSQLEIRWEAQVTSAPDVHKTVEESIPQISISANINTMATEDKFARLSNGRQVLHDFSKKFSDYQEIWNGKSIPLIIQDLSEKFLKQNRIEIRVLNIKTLSFPSLKHTFPEWLTSQSEENIRDLAYLTGFMVIEHFYEWPLTLIASRIINDIQGIDFNLPVRSGNKDLQPQRSDNGELIINQPLVLAEYTPAQQFFYRRGPLFSNRVVLFFREYLAFQRI
ncbi:MAG: hypothetical protein HQM11_15600 [SAR324 cluster bacterium]|nr:hypothetical protein [SAR324 cluster bacterium]